MIPALVEEREANDGARSALHHVTLNVTVVKPTARGQEVLLCRLDLVAWMPIGVTTRRL